jgi:hypothetical protein
MMNKLDKSGFLRRHPYFPFPFQVLACGIILLIDTPLGCALFPQIDSIPTSLLEKSVKVLSHEIDRSKITRFIIIGNYSCMILYRIS